MHDLGYSYEVGIYHRLDSNYRSNAKTNEVLLNQFDLLILSVPSRSINSQYYFTTPYAQIEYFIVSRPDLPYTGLRDLSGKDIIVLRGSTAYKSLSTIGTVHVGNIIETINIPMAIKLMAEGMADYMVIDDHTLRSFRHSIANNKLQLSLSNFEPLRLAMASSDAELIRLINNKILTYKNDGTLEELYDKWVKTDEESNTTLIYTIAAILLAITALSLLLSYTHRRAARRAAHKAQIALHRNEELIAVVNLLVQNNDTEIFMYDTFRNESFKLCEGRFEPFDMDILNVDARVHPDDKERYMRECKMAYEGQVTKTSAPIRFYDVSSDSYEYYQVSIIPGQRDENGHLYRYFFSRRNETANTQEIMQMEETIGSFNMAIRSTGLIRWKFDLSTSNIKVTFSDLRETTLSIQDIRERTLPADRELLIEYIRQSKKGSKVSDITLQGILPGHDDYRVCHISSTTQFDKTGHATFMYGIINDITDETHTRQELEKSQHILQDIIDKMPIPVYIKECGSGLTVYVNDECKKVFGIQVGTLTSKLESEEFANKCDEIDRRIFSTGEDYMANESVKRRDGSVLQTFVKKCLINYNNQKHILAVRIDLTEQEKLARVQRLISNSLPSLNAFTWTVDCRTEEFTFGSTGETKGVPVSAFNSINKCLNFVHPDDHHIFADTLRHHSRSNEEAEFSMTYRIRFDSNGEYEWWESRGVVEKSLLNDSNQMLIYGITVNVNQRVANERSIEESRLQLLHANRQNELILNNTSSGIVFIDADYVVQWSNLASQHIFRQCAGLYEVGQKCFHSFGRSTKCPSCPLNDHPDTNGSSSREFCFGQNRILDLTATPVIHNGQREGAVLRIDDITELKKLIGELRSAKEKAEESERLKMAFLANMSHEIRTPLNAIVGFSGLLPHIDDEAERNEYIGIINKNNDLLLHLINDILDLSKIESGMIDLRPEEFDLSLMFHESYTLWKQQNSNPNIEINLDCPYPSCRVTLDRNRFRQVGSNFMSNALKHTTNGSVTMGYSYQDGGIRFYVRDTGSGIPQEKLQLIFERFYKVNDFVQGTGLGLAICKAITEACGGQIGVESTAGVGSEFWAWFPCEVEIAECE